MEEIKDLIRGGQPIACEIRTDEGIRFFSDNLMGTLRTIEACGCKHIIEPMKEIKCEQVSMLQGGKWDKMHEQSKRVYGIQGLAPTMHTCGGGNLEPKIAEPLNLKKYGSYYTWKDKQGNINTQCNRAVDVNGCALTLSAAKTDYAKIIEPIAYDEQNQYVRCDGTVGTLTTDGSSPKHNNRIVEPQEIQVYDGFNQQVRADQSTVGALTRNVGADLKRNGQGIVERENYNYRVRKLTERECFKLMGVKVEDYEKVRQNQSKSSCYHLAGDSIMTPCLMALFGQMLGVDWNKKVNELVQELTK